MRIAIAGGTGTVGAEAARELERRGHAVRVLSRRAPEHAVDLRTTQFHPFTAQTFASSARFGIVPDSKFPMQPVDPHEVGRVLAETAEAEPLRASTSFVGPEVVSARELARRLRVRTGSRALLVRLPVTRAAFWRA